LKESKAFLQQLQCEHIPTEDIAWFLLLVVCQEHRIAYNPATGFLKFRKPPSGSYPQWKQDIKHRFENLYQDVQLPKPTTIKLETENENLTLMK
jgi:hypothetical protein